MKYLKDMIVNNAELPGTLEYEKFKKIIYGVPLIQFWRNY